MTTKKTKCRCEGCSRLGWLIVRLPEPLYRLFRRSNSPGTPTLEEGQR